MKRYENIYHKSHSLTVEHRMVFGGGRKPLHPRKEEFEIDFIFMLMRPVQRKLDNQK